MLVWNYLDWSNPTLQFSFTFRMIKAILIFNNHGKPRLNKFYQYYVSDSEPGQDLINKDWRDCLQNESQKGRHFTWAETHPAYAFFLICTLRTSSPPNISWVHRNWISQLPAYPTLELHILDFPVVRISLHTVYKFIQVKGHHKQNLKIPWYQCTFGSRRWPFPQGQSLPPSDNSWQPAKMVGIKNTGDTVYIK